MCDARTNLCKVITEQVRDTFEGQIRIFESRIPNTVKVGESVYYSEPLIEYAPESNATKAYSRNGVTYRYFTGPHAKEQTGEDGCCKRYVIEDNLNEIVWSVIRQLLDMTDAFKQKLDKQNNVSRQDSLILVEKLVRLQLEKEKCESDRFVNVDQFMAGQLDKEVYQRRRADLGRLAEKLDADIAELEQKLKDAETMKDDSLSQALSVMKKYSGANEMTQAMVQELIEKVVVTDPEHVEIVWKFKDEVRNFIGI